MTLTLVVDGMHDRANALYLGLTQRRLERTLEAGISLRGRLAEG